jgi:hypothetical protein
MVGHREMNRFVCYHVSEHEIGCEDESPVERQVSPGRAIPPLSALTHHIHPLDTLSKPHKYCSEVALDFRSRLLSQPVLEAAYRRGLRPRPPPHDDFPTHEDDTVPSRTGRRRLDAHPRRLPTEKNLANPALLGSPQAAQALYALELSQNPHGVAVQECRHFLTLSRHRLHDVDAVRAHSEAQLSCGSRMHDAVRDAASTKPDLMLRG